MLTYASKRSKKRSVFAYSSLNNNDKFKNMENKNVPH